MGWAARGRQGDGSGCDGRGVYIKVMQGKVRRRIRGRGGGGKKGSDVGYLHEAFATAVASQLLQQEWALVVQDKILELSDGDVIVKCE